MAKSTLMYNCCVPVNLSDSEISGADAASDEESSNAPGAFPDDETADAADNSNSDSESSLPASKRSIGFKLIAFLKRWRHGKPPHPDREIRHIENQEEMIKWLRINAKLLTPLHSFYRGIALGLGIVVGTGIVLSLLIHLFAQLALVPIFGDFARQILNYLESTNGTS